MTTTRREIIQADWTWTGSRFEPDVQVEVGPDGVITRVGVGPDRTSIHLPHHALLPGMINVHSHAFQRGLRGLGERFPAGAGSFWTWREAMYSLVASMTADKLYELSLQAFREMLAAGITTVGEFHYVHHDASCTGFAFDDVVLKAAEDAGIRIVLLNTYYRTGGVGQPLAGGQLRFAVQSPREYWAQMDRLAARIRPGQQSLGAVAHSIRAATIDEIAELYAESRRRGMVFHIHVEEQLKEIEDCVAAYGKRPMALLLDRLDPDDRLTAIHCTHTADEDLRRFVGTGAHVCLCPISEANLGDGIANVPLLRTIPGSICVGTDANTRASMAEELRWIEYVQRLHRQQRGICRDEEGRVAGSLFDMATVHGARALGIAAGAIAPGHAADLFAIDLGHPSLAGWNADSLLESFVFGAADDAVGATFVAGSLVHRRRPDSH